MERGVDVTAELVGYLQIRSHSQCDIGSFNLIVTAPIIIGVLS